MRSAICWLCATLVAAACSTSQPAMLGEAEAVRPAQSASLLGDWVLANTEQTQFTGASRVELQLRYGEFRLVAHYPGSSALAVDGSASFDPNGGRLTLTPRSNTRAASGTEAPLLPVGVPIIMLATAADNTMVFAEPGETVRMPTSIWHRARAAGQSDPGARLDRSDSVQHR
jgi:hypothetical protein